MALANIRWRGRDGFANVARAGDASVYNMVSDFVQVFEICVVGSDGAR